MEHCLLTLGQPGEGKWREWLHPIYESFLIREGWMGGFRGGSGTWAGVSGIGVEWGCD